MNHLLPGIEPTDSEWVSEMSLAERVERALALLRVNEPPDGYYLGYSGGKDSDAIKKLAQLAGVKFEATYNQTTIDPPEVVRHVKSQPDVKWNIPETNMMIAVAGRVNGPPTRLSRWCCELFKEGGGEGRVKILGVRAEESAARKKRWSEIAKDKNGDTVICPIVFWTEVQLWEFLKAFGVKYCSLYDEGWKRLGCVGCPLASQENIAMEFARWPAFERNWKKAVIKNWEKWRGVPNLKGHPRFQAKFKTAEDFWQWWRFAKKTGVVNTELCQSELLYTNATAEE